MRRSAYIAIIGSMIFLVTALTAYAQKELETPNRGGYVIGPEDVLYIHVWKEEALSKTTILQIIPVAGGFTEWAREQRKIFVVRKENGGEKRMTQVRIWS